MGQLEMSPYSVFREAELPPRLYISVPQSPSTRLQPGGDVAGLLIRTRELGFVDLQLLRQLLLAKTVPCGR